MSNPLGIMDSMVLPGAALGAITLVVVIVLVACLMVCSRTRKKRPSVKIVKDDSRCFAETIANDSVENCRDNKDSAEGSNDSGRGSNASDKASLFDDVSSSKKTDPSVNKSSREEVIALNGDVNFRPFRNSDGIILNSNSNHSLAEVQHNNVHNYISKDIYGKTCDNNVNKNRHIDFQIIPTKNNSETCFVQPNFLNKSRDVPFKNSPSPISFERMNGLSTSFIGMKTGEKDPLLRETSVDMDTTQFPTYPREHVPIKETSLSATNGRQESSVYKTRLAY